MEVQRLNAGDPLFQVILKEIKTRLMRDTVPKFFNYFSKAERTFDDFAAAIDGLHAHYHVYLAVISQAWSLRVADTESPEEELNKWFRAALLSQLPLEFDRLVYTYFEYSFRVFSGTMAASEQDHEMDGELAKDEFSCHICEGDELGCKCSAVLQRFRDTNRKLLELGIMERLCGPTIAHLVEEKIQSLTAEMCQGMLRSNSRLLENWLEKVVLDWLGRIYQFEEAEQSSAGGRSIKPLDRERLRGTFLSFKHRLEHFLCETYARIIIDQFFNIIIGECNI